MITGTHNTMSYLPVRQWWLRPFRAWGRCQRLTMAEQFREGVRYFDLRIKFDRDGTARFGHGLITYAGASPEGTITELCRLARVTGETIYVRILLESSRHGKHFEAWASAIEPELDRSGVRYCIGTKQPYTTLCSVGFDLPCCEVAKHYDIRAHFLLPPSAWLWEQRRIKAAVRQTGFCGILAEDFIS